MLYTRYAPISKNQWNAFIPLKSDTEPIARIRCDGRGSITVFRHTLSFEEMASLLDFMQVTRDADKVVPPKAHRKPAKRKRAA